MDVITFLPQDLWKDILVFLRLRDILYMRSLRRLDNVVPDDMIHRHILYTAQRVLYHIDDTTSHTSRPSFDHSILHVMMASFLRNNHHRQMSSSTVIKYMIRWGWFIATVEYNLTIVGKPVAECAGGPIPRLDTVSSWKRGGVLIQHWKSKFHL